MRGLMKTPRRCGTVTVTSNLTDTTDAVCSAAGEEVALAAERHVLRVGHPPVADVNRGATTAGSTSAAWAAGSVADAGAKAACCPDFQTQVAAPTAILVGHPAVVMTVAEPAGFDMDSRSAAA